jgi:hypothetical protein
MPADRGMRTTDRPVAAPGTATPPVREPLPRMLALQRSAGNAAVARLLQRQGWPDARHEPGPGQDGGWNAGAPDVAGTVRIAVAGVAAGNKADDSQPATKASAAHRAIVVGPNVHYSSSAHVPGVSLGMYGPVAVAGARRGAATVTVEVPQWDLSGKRDDLEALIDVHAQTLPDVFLGR